MTEVEVSRAKPVRWSSHIDDRNHIFNFRNMEKHLSAEAVVIGSVARICKRNLMFGYVGGQHSNALSAEMVPFTHLVCHSSNSASTSDGLPSKISW